ncbi:cytochrome c oxidase assembly protein [Acidicapsa ligni]|uniref:cytochrome c oxidase assembly protein n=1 Tax=Acidicapsa ligni TaxID=542300 RepID=UPI0021DF4C8B|nr:cytochrome c oxidase assembly protein [Acidicapsa ligni]
MSPAVKDIFADWSLPIWLTTSVVLTAVIYVRGWFAIRKTRPAQFTEQRLASFLSGLAVLWLAIGSPMDGFADAMLSAHMIEHLLLMSFVPPLLLYGLPVVPLLRGLPVFVRRTIIGPLLRVSPLRQFSHWIVTPLVAWLAMNLTFLAWHIPGAYDFALEHENWHAFEHLCFLFTSCLFWWCILRPWPAERRLRTWSILLYLVSADIVNTLLSAFLAFCGRPVYSYYLDHPNPFQVSAADDQVLGAVVMWVFGSMVFLVPAMIIALRLAGMQPKNVESPSRRTTNL